MLDFKSPIYYNSIRVLRISGCGAAGDVSERCRWQIKRGIRSGSNKPIDKQAFACDGRGAVATGSAADGMQNAVSRLYNHDNIISGCGAAGSAGGLGPSGRRFEPCHSDQKADVREGFCFFFILLFRDELGHIFSFFIPQLIVRLCISQCYNKANRP